MPYEGERIPQKVTDIGSDGQLLRYALAGQLERLLAERPDLSQASIAAAAGLSNNRRNCASALSRALRDGPAADQLVKLDQIIGALASNPDGTGGLSSLALRLSADRSRTVKDGLIAEIPPSWTGRMLRDRPSTELEVLIQASSLLSAFVSADKLDGGRSRERIKDRYRAEIEVLVRRLITLSAAPPTTRTSDAQILLGILASYAFDLMRDPLEVAVRYSPLAFRVWRAIGKLVQLRSNGGYSADLMAWVRRLLRDSGELRKQSLYAGRGLDLELALVVPAAWSPPGADWVGEMLRARTHDPEATVRERGTAAMGLWRRALTEDRDRRPTEAELRRLITEFRDPATRPDAAAGLRWVAATLEHVIERGETVCNDWPAVDEPWFRHVQEAAGELDDYGIPEHLKDGAKNLFRHMILQNAGADRRRALETVVTSSLHRPFAQALGFLLAREQGEAWLRIRVEFALGFLQRPNEFVETDLAGACLVAYRNLGLGKLPDDAAPPRSRISEMHASLFAVGDCFGVQGAEERARSVRDRLHPVLMDLATLGEVRGRILRRACRAVAYVLTVTAQPREGDEPDLSRELLGRLAGHPDPVTAKISQWALSFRFAPDGSVRPLLDAAEFGLPVSRPY